MLLAADAGAGGKILLTCKKTLVGSKLPIVDSLEVCVCDDRWASCVYRERKKGRNLPPVGVVGS